MEIYIDKEEAKGIKKSLRENNFAVIYIRNKKHVKQFPILMEDGYFKKYELKAVK